MPDEVVTTETTETQPEVVETTAPETTETTETTTEAGGRDRSIGGRISELTAARREAERDAAYWRGQAEAAQRGNPGNAADPRTEIGRKFVSEIKSLGTEQATANLIANIEAQRENSSKQERVAREREEAEGWIEQQPEYADEAAYLRDGRAVWAQNPSLRELSKTHPKLVAEFTIAKIREMRAGKTGTQPTGQVIPKSAAASSGATGAGAARKPADAGSLAQQLQDAAFLPLDKRQGEVARIEQELAKLGY